MIATALLAVVGLYGAFGSSAVSDASLDCQFAIVPEARAPQIRGPSDITSRAIVMHQPDSPVAVVGVDLTGMNLVAGSGFYEVSGRYSVTIKNISDRALQHVQVRVSIGSRMGAVGGGVGSPRPLEPGATAHINFRSGRGGGTGPHDDDEVR